MRPIKYDYLNTRLRNFLNSEKITTVEQLAAYGRIPMMRAPNIGRKSIKEAEHILRQHSLTFVEDTWYYGFVKSGHMPDGYGGRWLQDEVKDPRIVKLVNNLINTADFMRIDSIRLAQVILDGADEIVDISKRLVKSETSLAISQAENEIRRADGVQMWKATAPKLTEEELKLASIDCDPVAFKLAFETIMSARRNALEGKQ